MPAAVEVVVAEAVVVVVAANATRTELGLRKCGANPPAPKRVLVDSLQRIEFATWRAIDRLVGLNHSIDVST